MNPSITRTLTFEPPPPVSPSDAPNGAGGPPLRCDATPPGPAVAPGLPLLLLRVWGCGQRPGPQWPLHPHQQIPPVRGRGMLVQ